MWGYTNTSWNYVAVWPGKYLLTFLLSRSFTIGLTKDYTSTQIESMYKQNGILLQMFLIHLHYHVFVPKYTRDLISKYNTN